MHGHSAISNHVTHYYMVILTHCSCEQKDGQPLPRDRARVVEGSLIIENLHQNDYGEYECVASNEVATLLKSTKIIVEGTKPHAPFNITATSAVFSVTLHWIAGYSGGPDFRQNYVVW